MCGLYTYVQLSIMVLGSMFYDHNAFHLKFKFKFLKKCVIYFRLISFNLNFIKIMFFVSQPTSLENMMAKSLRSEMLNLI